MMIINKKIATLATISFWAFQIATAQELTKEITVDHDIVPEKREASKLSFLPVVELDPVKRAMLDIASKGVAIQPSPGISTLAPAAYGDTLATYPWRGYAAVGYLPTYNLGASAGYRFIDNDKTRLGAWLQFDGNSYNGSLPQLLNINEYKLKRKIKNNAVTFGASLHQSVSRNSFIEANLGYQLAKYTSLGDVFSENLPEKSVNRLNVDLAWTSRSNSLLTWVSGGYSLFANGGDRNPYYEAPTYKFLNENRVKFNAGAQLSTSELSKVMADASLSVIKNSCTRNNSHGLLSLKPAYRYSSSAIDATVGAKVELTFNSGKAFHVAPDINFVWRPLNVVGIQAHAGGGEWQNTQSSIAAITPYATPFYAFQNSHVPITLDARVAIGPFKGFSFELYGAYAVANDWLMPTVEYVGISDRYSNSSNLDYSDHFTQVDHNFDNLDGDLVWGTHLNFSPTKFRGGMFGAALAYNDSRWGNAKISYEMAPSKSNGRYERGWYLWRDRAKNVMRAEIHATPLKPLAVDVAWELRTRRHSYDDFVAYGKEHRFVAKIDQSLSTLANLNVGASWSFNQRLSIFARGENLLGRSYLLIGSMPAQGLHGLVGATYKF